MACHAQAAAPQLYTCPAPGGVAGFEVNDGPGCYLPGWTIHPAFPMILVTIRTRILLVGPEVNERTLIGDPLAMKMNPFDSVIILVHADLGSGDEHSVRRPSCVRVRSTHRSGAWAVAAAEILAHRVVRAGLVYV